MEGSEKWLIDPKLEASESMKLTTFNILEGGSHRVHWANMIDDLGVELLLVQESYQHDEHRPQRENGGF